MVDASVFDADYDLAGKRHRSLDLYGIDEQFRSTDRFDEAHRRIVVCAAHFCRASGAAITVWPRSGRTVLAHTGVDATGAIDAMWHLVTARTPGPLTAATGSWDETWQMLAAPVEGREQVPLGLLSVWTSFGGTWPMQAPLLVEQLAQAAVTVLEGQRRVWSVRTASGSSPLRLVDGRDRRRAGHS